MTGQQRSPGTRPPARSDSEAPLPGGVANRGLVVRVGDTVRRPQRSTSPAAHALLRHLEAVGFAGAPRFRGVDSRGREVLGYIPGTAAVPPFPDWALTEEALVSVAHLLRDYHQAVAGFDPAPYAWPQSPPEAFGRDIVSHNDLNLDNVVFREGRAVAFIDWDLAGPGSRLWDVACAARQWAPLRPDAAIHDARRGRTFERLRLFVDSYGLDDADRGRVVAAVQENHAWFGRLIARYVAAGHAAFTEYSQSSARVEGERYRRWLADNADALETALRG